MAPLSQFATTGDTGRMAQTCNTSSESRIFMSLSPSGLPIESQASLYYVVDSVSKTEEKLSLQVKLQGSPKILIIK